MRLAATNKCLAQSNKSRGGDRVREIGPEMSTPHAGDNVIF
jgi:hypothetical protein